MFTMIFVNDFWKVHDVPHWLEHTVYGEDFMGLADIVFPLLFVCNGNVHTIRHRAQIYQRLFSRIHLRAYPFPPLLCW